MSDPSKEISIVEVHACPFCGSGRLALVRGSLVDVEDGVPGTYAISRCEDCRLVFLSTRPSVESISSCYSGKYHIRDASRGRGLKSLLFRKRHEMRLEMLSEAVGSPPDSVLEIGCGDGSFLRVMRERYGEGPSLMGIDLSIDEIPVVPGSNIVYRRGTLDTLEIEDRFDLILLYNVLEHLAEPFQSLKRIHELLAPGGMLAGQVPNWDSPFRKMFPGHWSGLQVPRHLTFFSRGTLQNGLLRAGFGKAAFRNIFDPGDLSVSAGNYLVDALNIRASSRSTWFFLPLTFFCAPIVLAHMVLWRNSGEMFFLARK